MKLPKISQRAVLFTAFALSTCSLLLSLGLVRYRPAKPTEPKGIFGASANYAYPVGPAGGGLSGTYPDPNVAVCSSCTFADATADASQDGDLLLTYNPTTGQTFYGQPGDLAYFDAWHVAQLGGNPVAQFVDAAANGCLTPSGANKCVLELIDGSIGLGDPICTNACSASAGTRAYYGSGVDGVVHLTTSTTTFNGGSCTAGACTLSRTGAYTNLTIDSGVTLATAGWGIYYTGTLALAGTISDDGSSGASGGAGAPHEGYGGGSNGGAGDSAGTGGAAGVTFSGNIGFGGTGGAGGMGGASGGTAGGAGGGLNNGISLPAQSIPSVDWLSGVIPGVGSPTSAPSASGIGGGAGGGGGGCGGTAIAVCSEGDGGQGGGGGGLMVLSGAVRTGAGAIHARGGAGQAGTSLGGAGGGGGGGTVLDICGDLSGYTGTIDENGGTGANPGANGQYLYIQG